MKKKSFMLYTDNASFLETLSDEQAGILFRAVFDYHLGREVNIPCPVCSALFPILRAQFDRDEERYQAKCAKNKENIKIRWNTKDTNVYERIRTDTNVYERIRTDTKHTDSDSDRESDSVSGISNLLCLAEPNCISNKVSSASATLEADSSQEESFYLTRKKRKLTGKRLESFNRFWKAFAYPKGKAEAADSWYDIPQLTNQLVETIIAAAEREAKGRDRIIASGHVPKFAQGWLTGKRWEDEQVAAPGRQYVSPAQQRLEANREAGRRAKELLFGTTEDLYANTGF